MREHELKLFKEVLGSKYSTEAHGFALEFFKDDEMFYSLEDLTKAADALILRTKRELLQRVEDESYDVGKGKVPEIHILPSDWDSFKKKELGE